MSNASIACVRVSAHLHEACYCVRGTIAESIAGVMFLPSGSKMGVMTFHAAIFGLDVDSPAFSFRLLVSVRSS